MRSVVKRSIGVLDSSFKTFTRKLHVVGILISKELNSPIRLSFKNCLKAWKNGYLSQNYALHFEEHNNYKDYISDYIQLSRVTRINERRGILLADKMLFYDFLSPYHEYLPTIFGEINDAHYFPKTSKSPLNNFDDLYDLLVTKKALVLKPISSFGGRGIFICKYENNEIYINRKPYIADDFKNLVHSLKRYLVSEFAHQADYARRIFPRSTNTIRIVTMFDQESRKAFVAEAFHRFGTNNSNFLDNTDQGGLCTYINIESGIMGKSFIRKEKGRKINWMDKHPDTNENINGVQVPHWNSVKAKVLEISEYFHYCPYIGWDVLVTENDLYIIEGNDQPISPQLFNPFLLNPSVKKFYQFHKVIQLNL